MADNRGCERTLSLIVKALTFHDSYESSEVLKEFELALPRYTTIEYLLTRKLAISPQLELKYQFLIGISEFNFLRKRKHFEYLSWDVVLVRGQIETVNWGKQASPNFLIGFLEPPIRSGATFQLFLTSTLNIITS